MSAWKWVVIAALFLLVLLYAVAFWYANTYGT